MKRQIHFETPEDDRRILRQYMRDKLFQLIIIVLSFLAIGAMSWLTFNGERIDNKVEMHINHLMR